MFWSHPPGNSNPYCGGVWIFSGTAKCISPTENSLHVALADETHNFLCTL